MANFIAIVFTTICYNILNITVYLGKNNVFYTRSLVLHRLPKGRSWSSLFCCFAVLLFRCFAVLLFFFVILLFWCTILLYPGSPVWRGISQHINCTPGSLVSKISSLSLKLQIHRTQLALPTNKHFSHLGNNQWWQHINFEIAALCSVFFHQPR